MSVSKHNSESDLLKITKDSGFRTSTSIHPWYYVPGKPYLCEKRLSAKHESDNRKQILKEEAHKYFL